MTQWGQVGRARDTSTTICCSKTASFGVEHRNASKKYQVNKVSKTLCLRHPHIYCN